uniref:Uncharacterized protein n=1 Tax=Chromera velia CCMP2878 TaxID=1169474 RepID=A0A0G4FJ76_9ALVE|eukprot:Cvel_17332.t1-p1 / transcript=Cvel_17332.t1 / gene=Cvel_17332 / organism=Chromera_velia_CCMP2878 / gene_product=hypothetical protein / transcript_product=hypothetical protein / location=Cvel_scaffold1377:12824-13357(+) / protein_length=178 / sequence_SO=supercontig / SO=protein_coding / is_pseudo=false
MASQPVEIEGSDVKMSAVQLSGKRRRPCEGAESVPGPGTLAQLQQQPQQQKQQQQTKDQKKTMSRREGLSVADPLVTPVREQPLRLYGRVCAELPIPQEVEYPTLVQKANDLYTNVVGFLQAHGQPVEEDYVKTLVIRNLRQWGVRKDTIPSDAELQELLFCAIHLHGDDSSVDGQAA